MLPISSPRFLSLLLLTLAASVAASGRGGVSASAGAGIRPDVRCGSSRGYLTTPQELVQISVKAKQGVEPYASAYRQVIEYVNRPRKWPAPSGRVTCPSPEQPGYLIYGSQLVYAKALAYHLTGNLQYARDAQEGIEGLLNVSSFGAPGNSAKPDRQCQLNLSWFVPGFIRAADLLEDYSAWRRSGTKYLFQEWLAKVVYPTISFTAEVSVSNWGAAATNACTYIADYLWDRPDLTLVSYNRLDAAEPTTARSPAEAYEHAIQLALGRMNGTRAEGKGGSPHSCDLDPATKSMIRPDGGLPDELRRGSTGCGGGRILQDDHSNMYSQTHLQNLVAQAELLLRRGDRRIYDNVQTTATRLEYEDAVGVQHSVPLPQGRGSLKQAILFVLDRPSFQKVRALKSAAEVAYRYYRCSAMLKAVKSTRPNSGGRAMSFETLTHGFAEGEEPGPPPTAPPPGVDSGTEARPQPQAGPHACLRRNTPA